MYYICKSIKFQIPLHSFIYVQVTNLENEYVYNFIFINFMKQRKQNEEMRAENVLKRNACTVIIV